jgi:2'-5' RNA ligase
MPRLFTAVDLPLATREALLALGDPRLGGKWVTPEQMHVTLRFLGSVAAEQVPVIVAALGRVTSAPFALALAGVGAFPRRAGPSAPRVLWAGVAPHGPVQALKAAIDAALGPDPESSGRDFTPHVTLARLPHTRGLPLAPYLAAQAALTSASWPVDSFALYESRTLPGGAEYRVLKRYSLG